MGDDPAIGGDQRNAHHERQREPHPLVQALVAPVEDGPVARAGATGEPGIEQERPEKGAGHRADGQRGDAHAALEEQAADDGAQGIDEGGHGLDAELPAHQEHRAKNSAGEEAQLGRKQNAGEVDTEGGFFRVEAGEHAVDVPGGDDLGEQDGAAQDQVHGGENDGEGPLPVGFAAGVAIAGEDGDQGG